MTVLGIGGCMITCWICVKDSIMTIGDRQYNFIHTYQVKMTLADADTDEEEKGSFGQCSWRVDDKGNLYVSHESYD